MKKDDKNIMDESLKRYGDLSQKKPPEEPAAYKMIANLKAAAKDNAKKTDESEAILMKPLKGETKEHFKERLKKTMKLPSKNNRFGMNDADIVIEKKNKPNHH